jgi:four helix bundle protein
MKSEGDMRAPKGLHVWQKAHQLTLRVYKETEAFPQRERFGLSDQTRRASASIPANIAEGCGRRSQRDFARYLQVCNGSTNELEYHLLLARDLGYLKDGSHMIMDKDLAELRQMLSSLLRKVRKDSSGSRDG